MTYPGFLRRRLLTYFPAIFVTLCIAVFGFYLDHLRFKTQQQELRHSISDDLSLLRAKLEGNINSEAQLIKGLIIAISTEPAMSHARFKALTAPLLTNHSQLRNIAAAPDLVIKYMYPLEGNEAAVGLNYRENKEQYSAVKQAIDARELLIAGPVNLVQGGKGFIARIPVFMGDDKNKLWGLISAVIDTEKFYQKSGLRNTDFKFELAIRGKDANGERGEVFFGNEAILTSSPVYANVSLPFGSWQLAAIPKGGWPLQQNKRGVFFIFILLAGLLIITPLVILGRFLEKRRESDALLSGLFELSPIGIALNDYETGAFVKVNSALVNPTGYSEEEFVKLSYWDLTPIEYELQEKEQLENLEKNHSYGPYEKEYIRKDGTRYPVLLQGIMLQSTSGKKMIWSIVEDISERKQNEKVKSEFISTVSHELRTPLTSISGAVSLAIGGAFGELPLKATETLKLAQSNSERLSFLINDLLDFEKLYARKMKFDFHDFDIVSQVRDSIRSNQSYADKYKVELRFSSGIDEIYVNVDNQRLQQVLSNLLSNAAKFSTENNHVDVAVMLRNGLARVEVVDYGEGIPEEFYGLMFSKFSQADSSDTRAKGGTGLGLAISKEIIEQMNGKIGFESEKGKGSTFYFELPVKSQGGTNDS